MGRYAYCRAGLRGVFRFCMSTNVADTRTDAGWMRTTAQLLTNFEPT